ncbi:MAG: cell wall/surface repeat protein, partial [Bacteroidetes bacterium]|nr:cell wall/surface repeat protein [Bacteroidota bacterium]
DWLEVTGTMPTAGACSSSARAVAPAKLELTDTRVYPNPATQTAVISFYNEKTDRVQVRMYSSNGQLLKTVVDKELPAGNNQLTVDVSSLPQSLYLIKVENSAGSNTLKLVKQ